MMVLKGLIFCMKFSVSFLLTAVLSFIAGLYFPWWSIAIAAFIVALLVNQKAGMAFVSAFFAMLLLWSGLAWWINVNNENILSLKIAELLGIGNNTFLLVLITGIIGGLVGGLAAMSGSFLRARKV